MPVEPEPYTTKEVQDKLLRAIDQVARYWAELPDKTPLERTRGALFSLLVILDGEDGTLPAFSLTPDPNSGDKAYHINRGERYYPHGPKFDIAGSLHDEYSKLWEE